MLLVICSDSKMKSFALLFEIIFAFLAVLVIGYVNSLSTIEENFLKSSLFKVLFTKLWGITSLFGSLVGIVVEGKVVFSKEELNGSVLKIETVVVGIVVEGKVMFSKEELNGSVLEIETVVVGSDTTLTSFSPMRPEINIFLTTFTIISQLIVY